MKNYLGILFMFLMPLQGWSQQWPADAIADTTISTTPPKLSITAYIKDMQALDFSENFERLYATNLIHNRINLKWKPDDHFTAYLEIRNRFIWGDDVRNIPNYAQRLRNANETVNLSTIWFAQPAYVLHTNIDRLSVAYERKALALRVGRQRINWGMSSVWNPNDLFNTYNFLDFDYEERPGSDAVKFTANIGSFSGIELAYTPGSTSSDPVLAGKYTFNTQGYDLQGIAGMLGNRFTAGVGWAGSIADAGFKGEAQIFTETATQPFQINLTLESDYVFQNGWYLNGSFLFNNNGIDTKSSQAPALNFAFSPTSLMPTKWNFLLSTRKELTPLFSASLSVIYAPGPDLLLLLPGLRYSLSENLSANLIWQSSLIHLQPASVASHRGFLRLKYDF